jgi:arylsulfatase
MTRWASLGHDWANVSNTPFRYFKNFSHEGGINTPMIAYWPEMIRQAGSVSHSPGHFIDLMPTLLDVSGAEYPGELNGKEVLPFEGQSLLPVFAGGEVERVRPLYWEWGRGKAVRRGKWKAVKLGEEPWELYDMEVDKTETNDLAGRYPDVVNELESLHAAWRERCVRQTVA